MQVAIRLVHGAYASCLYSKWRFDWCTERTRPVSRPVGTLHTSTVQQGDAQQSQRQTPTDPTLPIESNEIHMASHGSVGAVVTRVRRFKRYLWHEPNPLVQIFYLLLIVGGFGAFLYAGLPHLPNAYLSEVHIVLSGAVVLLAMHSFIVASTTSPGILTPQTIPFFDSYESDGVLYAAPPRNCITCKTVKPARSKHCAVCNFCVPRFDHHCVWINACIGERNHRHFLYFLLANVVLCAYGSFVLFFILYHEFLSLHDQPFVDSESGQVIQGVMIVELRFLIHAESILFVLFALCALMGIAVLGFFVFHCYLVLKNMTTNEFFKLRSLRAVYDAQNRQQRDSHACSRIRFATEHIYSLGSVVANVKEVCFPRCDQKLREHLERRAKTKDT